MLKTKTSPGACARVEYSSVQEACRAMIKVNPAQDPIAENIPKYAEVYEVYKKLYASTKNLFKELGGLDA